jgi:hypothetical protein
LLGWENLRCYEGASNCDKEASCETATVSVEWDGEKILKFICKFGLYQMADCGISSVETAGMAVVIIIKLFLVINILN